MNHKAEFKKAKALAMRHADAVFYDNMGAMGYRMFDGEWHEVQEEPAVPLVDQACAAAPGPLLHEAQALIHGQRQQDYGDKLTNFSQVSMMWQGYLAPKLAPDARITPEDVTFLMILLKLARLSKSPDHRDSILDVAGYAGCADYLQQERAAGISLQGALRDARNS